MFGFTDAELESLYFNWELAVAMPPDRRFAEELQQEPHKPSPYDAAAVEYHDTCDAFDNALLPGDVRGAGRRHHEVQG